MHTSRRQQIARGKAVSSECQLVSAVNRSDQTFSNAHTRGMSALTNTNSRCQYITWLHQYNRTS